MSKTFATTGWECLDLLRTHLLNFRPDPLSQARNSTVQPDERLVYQSHQYLMERPESQMSAANYASDLQRRAILGTFQHARS